jgi:microcystin-dependent protein
MGFVSSSLLPAGVVFPYAGNTAPSSYLLCDGSAVSRTTYAALFAAIGTNYGSGDGSTTFNLPDTRNVFLRGANASTRTISTISYPAVTIGATTTDKMQGHYHSNWTNNFFAGGTFNATGVSNPNNTGGTTGVRDPITDGTNGTPRTGTETAPVNLGINYIIKF